MPQRGERIPMSTTTASEGQVDLFGGKTAYTPRFPHAHNIIETYYTSIMTTTEDLDIEIWSERLRILFEGWEALKKDGVLSPTFVESFHLDITNIMEKVNGRLDHTQLIAKQKETMFQLTNYRKMFGGK